MVHKSETGAIITKISAIINIILAILVFLAAIGVGIGIALIDWLPNWLSSIGILIAIVLFVFGLLVWRAGNLMQDPRTVKSGAVWAIVLGVITISTFTGILTLIGGIIALIESR
jgi:hypothetical protein